MSLFFNKFNIDILFKIWLEIEPSLDVKVI